MDKVVIVGAGISGLSLGYLLAKEGIHVAIIEKEGEVGGLTRTFRYEGFTFDIGPHRFHSEDKEVLDFIKQILNNEYLNIPRRSQVWMEGRYYNWPVSVKDIFKLPVSMFIRTLFDLFHRIPRSSQTFKDYILKMYGQALCSYFFEPYTKKFLGLSPDEIDWEWANAGIDRALINNNFKNKKTNGLFEISHFSGRSATNFIYPNKNGISELALKLKEKIREFNGDFYFHSEVKGLDLEGDIIRGVNFNGESVQADLIIWTAPITLLAKIVGSSDNHLRYLSTICYNLEVNHPPLKDFQWCYFGGKNIIFSRVSIPALFNNKSSPPGQHGLCVEVSTEEGGKLWHKPERIVSSIKSDLITTRLIKNKDSVRNIHIERISNVYPIYDLGFQNRLNKLINSLRRYENLILLGRTGCFWYSSIDHSIKMAMDICRRIINGQQIHIIRQKEAIF